MVNSKWIREALVFYDGDNQARWLDAIGNNVVKFELETGTPMDDTTGDPTRFVTTVVEAGTGDSLTVNSATAGEKLLITDAANEYDGVCLTLRGEAFALAAGCPAYFGARIKSSRADAELTLGLMETLAAYHAAAANTIVAAAVDGVCFRCDESSAVAAASYENNVLSASAVAVAALAITAHIYEIYWDGTYVNFYYDGTLVTSTAVALTTGALTPVLHFRNGTANVTTCTVSWMRAIQIN
jgi:hypothetical protein